MKVGDYATIDEIKNQSVCRWVLLSDLSDDIYGGVDGGIIRIITNTKKESWEKEVEMGLSDLDTLLVCGALEPLSVGGVFVE